MNTSVRAGRLALRRFMLIAAATLAVLAPALAVPAQAEAATAGNSRVSAFAAGPASVVKGKTITLSAQAQKLAGNRWANTGTVTATVYFDPDGSAPNKAFRTVRSNARGYVKLGIPAAVSGKWSLRLPGQAALKASSSGAKYVKVAPAPKPASSKPASKWNCPAWAPIKGNAPSRIYHLKGQRFYNKTTPEICFTTESAARNAGYRKSKV
ncbi:sunset domain-containing protein [Arthrobacter dokdonensis]|uniref:sunset domain-containing protein n=1 Tax=Arthrobacter dokdonellae TaxID=2211210 RepID=UPI000DE5A74C|nr:hypothetical protein [Arthrobacter dokdonellae]